MPYGGNVGEPNSAMIFDPDDSEWEHGFENIAWICVIRECSESGQDKIVNKIGGCQAAIKYIDEYVGGSLASDAYAGYNASD